MKEAFYGRMLAHYGEVVMVWSDHEDERPLTAVVRETANEETQNLTETDVELVTVRVGRDPAHELGGIAEPEPTLRMRREDDDAGSDPYAFTGEVLEKNPHSLLLRFTRRRVTRIGQR